MDHDPVGTPSVSPIPPPSKRRKFIKVERPKPEAPVSGIALHQDVTPVETHWHPYASGKVRHLAHGCQWCELGLHEPRWYCYMPAVDPRSGKIIALEITHHAAENCPAMSTKRFPLRGHLITVYRRGDNPTGPCSVVVEPNIYSKPLPGAIDVQDFLNAVFEKAERVPYCGRTPRWVEGVEP